MPSTPISDVFPAIALDSAGYLVSFTHIFSVVDKTPSARGGKAVMKKKEVTKFDYVDLDDIDRCGLLTTGLRVHELVGEYSPGQLSGFPVNMHYTASPYVLYYFSLSLCIGTDYSEL